MTCGGGGGGHGRLVALVLMTNTPLDTNILYNAPIAFLQLAPIISLAPRNAMKVARQ